MEAYATNDLFVEHPTKKGWWKIVGRVDDQIALSNGEKVSIIGLCMCHCAISQELV